MKRFLVLVLALVLTLSLAACGEKENNSSSDAEPTQAQATNGNTGEEETDAPAVDRLAFIENGEVYFDINLSDGVFDDLTIKLGEQAITASGKYSRSDTDTPVVEGTGNGSDIYVVVYTGPEVLFNEVTVATGDLQRALEIIFRSLAQEKTYIMISDKADGFDHALNASLTEYIEQYMTKE